MLPLLKFSFHALEALFSVDDQWLSATKDEQALTHDTIECSIVPLAFAFSFRRTGLLPNNRTLRKALAIF
jgi:hypothetical protein